jgi:hypothetical protein
MKSPHTRVLPTTTNVRIIPKVCTLPSNICEQSAITHNTPNNANNVSFFLQEKQDNSLGRNSPFPGHRTTTTRTEAKQKDWFSTTAWKPNIIHATSAHTNQVILKKKQDD